MKIKNINQVPIDELVKYLKQHKLSIECHDGKIRRFVKRN